LQLTANLTFNKGDIAKFDDHRIVATGSNPGLSCQNIGINGSTTRTVDYCVVDRSDEDLPRLPTQIYFAAAQYTFNTEFGTIIPRIQFSFRKDVDNCFDVSSCESGVYKVNQRDVAARLTWASPDKAWSLSAYGNNLTDQRYIIGGTPLVDVTQTAGTVYSDPRMYGVEAHYTW
jgi:iron complex outermembrane receptor protein